MDTECNDSDHDSHVAMELNPSYVALAEVYTCDSYINTANVHLQANPSYVALPMMASQGQDSVPRGSLPARRIQGAAALSIPLQGQCYKNVDRAEVQQLNFSRCTCIMIYHQRKLHSVKTILGTSL